MIKKKSLRKKARADKYGSHTVLEKKGSWTDTTQKMKIINMTKRKTTKWQKYQNIFGLKNPTEKKQHHLHLLKYYCTILYESGHSQSAVMLGGNLVFFLLRPYSCQGWSVCVFLFFVFVGAQQLLRSESILPTYYSEKRTSSLTTLRTIFDKTV